MLLTASKIEKWVGQRLLFKVDKLELFAGDRIGLVGVNGAGKSTLINILSGKALPDEGSVKLKGTVGIIEQLAADTAPLPVEMASRWAIGGGHSGGEQVRSRIAAALKDSPDIILADEPTANLDLAGIEQLEATLSRHEGALVLVSHDRTLLDNLCTRILEIDDGTVREYTGGFSDYWRQKEQEFEAQIDAYERNEQKRRQLEAAASGQDVIAARFQNQSENDYYRGAGKKVAKKASSIRSRIEKLPDIKKPRAKERVFIDFQDERNPTSRYPIKLEGLDLHIKGKTLLKDASLMVERGRKTAILGPNGCGKTTLLGRIATGGRGVKIAPDVHLGYFSQALDGLEAEKTILENIQAVSDYDVGMIRRMLARLLIRGEDVYKKVRLLSGGERVKAALAQVYLSRANVLMLDEPTNYLDLYSLQAMEDAFANYPGTLLFVSHDRMFVDKVADRIIEMKDFSLVEKLAEEKRTDSDKLLLEMRKAQLMSKISGASLEMKEQMSLEIDEINNKLKLL